MAQFEHVNLTISGAVATVQLNRPEKKNAMSPMLHQNMNDALTEVERDGHIKVVVVTGVADSFCGGMDLEQCFLEPFANPDEFARINNTALAWFKRLKAFPAVTIAKVNGWCFGGGVELAGICDIVITDEDARFGLSEINFGIFPGGGTMWATAHNFGRKQALYYALTGETFSGREAVALGMATKAVPHDRLDEVTQQVIEQLANKNQIGLRLTKEVYEKSVKMEFPESIDWEMAKLQELSYLTNDEWIRTALEQFHRRQYRPGLGTYRLEKE